MARMSMEYSLAGSKCNDTASKTSNMQQERASTKFKIGACKFSQEKAEVIYRW